MTESPIIIIGPGRTGSTWMQWCLTKHPNIYISGQNPFDWNNFFEFHEYCKEKGIHGINAAKHVGYNIHHHTGCSEEKLRKYFAAFIKNYVTGNDDKRKRWGGKFLNLFGDIANKFEYFFPKTKYIVCIRHPFNVFESYKNTFGKNNTERTFDQWMNSWVNYVQWWESNQDKAFLFRIDNPIMKNTEQRIQIINNIFAMIEEPIHSNVTQFIINFNIVHKVTEDDSRTFKLTKKEKTDMLNKNEKLKNYMEHFIYL